MRDAPAWDDSLQSAAPDRRLDQACNQFEAAWRAGYGPRLEDVLAAAPAHDRAAWLCELLPIEADYRRARGEHCRAAEYLARFPALDPAWLAEVLPDEA